LEAGAMVNEQDSDGWTSLHFAAFLDSKETAEILVNGKADINGRTLSGLTPLHVASIQDSSGVARYLLQVGADIHLLDDDGSTPLHAACCQGAVKVFKVLLDFKADTSKRDLYGETPIHITVARGAWHTTNYLLAVDSNGIDVKNCWGQTPLRLAVQGMHVALVKLLLSHPNSELNYQDNNGWTHLHAVVHAMRVAEESESGNSDNGIMIIHLLCNTGIDVNPRDNMGRTAVEVAANFGLANIVELLENEGDQEAAIISEYGFGVQALAERNIEERQSMRRRKEISRLRLTPPVDIS
jgi:serine/threonine-protein phosphatase 6 regulatory ankyrin repeat subunit A/serine/threonine-protein phosphatase 6 regulatory ankyrin repeat subunit B